MSLSEKWNKFREKREAAKLKREQNRMRRQKDYELKAKLKQQEREAELAEKASKAQERLSRLKREEKYLDTIEMADKKEGELSAKRPASGYFGFAQKVGGKIRKGQEFLGKFEASSPDSDPLGLGGFGSGGSKKRKDDGFGLDIGGSSGDLLGMGDMFGSSPKPHKTKKRKKRGGRRR